MSKNAFIAREDKYYEKLGIKKETAIWEDGIRTSGDKGTYEWWYFDSEYEDGTKVVVIFFTKNKFDVKGPANPTVVIDITLPNGKTISKSFSEGEGKKIRASKDKCDVKIGQSSIMYSNGNYEIHFAHDDIEYTCTMKSMIPMWRPGTGHMYFGKKQEDFFAWFVAQPSAKIDATLKISGKTFQLKGTGYHDHNWGNIEMNKIINHWYWCRVQIGSYTIIASDIVAEKKYGYSRIPVFLLSKNGEILEDNEEKLVLERLNTECHNITKKFMDNKLSFIYKGENEINYKLQFTRERDILAANLVDGIGLSKIKKIIAKAIGINPTYVRCIGKARLIVEENGLEQVLEGEALWEQMFFGNNKDAIIGE